MVSRLIQKKNIRVFQEQLAERDPRFLSAGEGVSLLGKSFLGKAQTLQYTCNFAFAGISVFCFKIRLETVVCFQPGIRERRRTGSSTPAQWNAAAVPF